MEICIERRDNKEREREEQRETTGWRKKAKKRGVSGDRSKRRKRVMVRMHDEEKKTPHFMKMRFSTTHDYNCHQRAQVI